MGNCKQKAIASAAAAADDDDDDDVRVCKPRRQAALAVISSLD